MNSLLLKTFLWRKWVILRRPRCFNSCLLCVSQQELSSLWCELQRDRPELLSALDGVLIHAVSHLQDSFRERDSLEQALRRSRLPPAVCCNVEQLIVPYSAVRIPTALRCLKSFIMCFRREIEHDEVVRSIYGEMENQIREEREKRLVQVHTCAIWTRRCAV